MASIGQIVARELTSQKLRRALLAGLSFAEDGSVLEFAVAELKRSILESCSAGRVLDALPEAAEMPELVEVCLLDAEEPRLPTRTEALANEAHLSCPHCRKPLELEVHWAHGSSPRQERYAYCAVLLDSGQISFLQALSLGESLIRTCTHERILLTSDGIPSAYLRVLECSWTLVQVGNWPLLKLDQNSTRTATLYGLLALGLHDYTKVLVLELGSVVRGNLDSLFAAACPAGSWSTKGPGCGTLPLLLEPCPDALRDIKAASSSEDALRRTFLSETWTKLPELIRLSHECTTMPAGIVVVLGSKCGWELSQKMLMEPEWVQEQKGSRGLIARLLRAAEQRHGLENERETVLDTLRKVTQYRCACSRYDLVAGGMDVYHKRWCCRYCSATRKALNERDVLELREFLGASFLPGEQRWFWKDWHTEQDWIEFRPRFTFLSSRGSGAWRRASEAPLQFELHLLEGRDEWRLTMEFCPGERGERLWEMRETRRAVSGPLGFVEQHKGPQEKWSHLLAMAPQPGYEIALPRALQIEPRSHSLSDAIGAKPSVQR